MGLTMIVEYVCRVCGESRLVGIEPDGEPGSDSGRVIDLNSKHRICTVYCNECDEERVHVIWNKNGEV